MAESRVRRKRRLLPVLLVVAAATTGVAQGPPGQDTDLPPQSISLASLAAFRAPTANWRVAGSAAADRNVALALTADAGTGVLVNTPAPGRNGHLFTTWEHGDLDLSLDVMLPKGSNSGVYLMGRYEVQLFDSWGVRAPTFADMGAIYQRWDDKRGAGREGYEPHPPRVNASRAPGLWQHIDIVFRAPRFEGRRKISNARFAKVTVNGVVVQENVEVTGPTRAAPFEDERATGPLMIQGDHGPVAVRNMGYKSYSGSAKVGDLRYRAWVGERMDSAWMSTHQPVREGTATAISSDPANAPNRFAVAFDGSLTVPTAGRHRLTLSLNWIGTEAAMRGVKIGGATLRIDGTPALVHLGDVPRATSDVELAAGKHTFSFSFYKNREWGGHRDVGLWIEGPGLERQALHDESALSTFGNPTNPIVVEPQQEPVMLRGFLRHRDTKRVIAVAVSDPFGVHYGYDMAQGALLHVWRGPFLEMTQMWHERAEDQTAEPMGSVVTLAGTPALAMLADANAAWPDSLDERQLRRDGYQLDKTGRPTFLYRVQNVAVEDDMRPASDGLSLRRELRLRATGAAEGLYVQLARAEHIARQGDGSFVAGDRSFYVVPASGTAQPIVRRVNNRDELIIPVRFERGEATVAYTLVW